MKYSSLLLVLLSYSAFAFYDLRQELYQRASAPQVSLSYNAARVKMFNELDLARDAQGLFIQDVYCFEKYYLYASGEVPSGRMPDEKLMNTEHTWPQSKFTPRHDVNVQKSDLHHLYPSISRINSDRGNLPFAEVTPGKEVYCQSSEVGTPTSRDRGTFFEPPTAHKGNVARSLFYFSVRYQIVIDPVQEYYLRQWHVLDPVDLKEKIRHEAITKIQKNRNPFIDEPALVNQILDF